MNHLLLIRFSALGDILMTVPVIKALAQRYPEMKITVVSRPFVGSVMERLPDNVHFVGVNPRNYLGMSGLGRLYRELSALKPTHVCDLHDVLRTKYLRLRFKLSGTPVSHIIKDRKARKEFLKSETKTQQETSFERYVKAIRRLGFDLTLPHVSGNKHDGEVTKIGIAPFAAHEGKIYPLDLMEKVVGLLSERGVKVYLFGAGDKEKTLMEEWASRYDNAESVVGTLGNMANELDLIETLDAMLTMDSGNMHLASLTATPVYSIWGATHPLGGFLGWGQTMDRCIQRDMPCRPCSIFGNKPCKFGNYPCLRDIKPEEIVKRICE